MNRILISGLLAVVLVLLTVSCNKTKSCIDPAKIDPSVVCPPAYAPVCGCDDVTYYNECEAERNGVRVWFGGPC